MRNTPMEFMSQDGHHDACDATSATSSAVGTRSCACAALRQRQSRLREGRLLGPEKVVAWEGVRKEEREGYGPRLVIAEVQVIHRIPRRQRSPHTVFTPARLWATTPARGRPVPLKEHIKPHRTHTTSPAGRRAPGWPTRQLFPLFGPLQCTRLLSRVLSCTVRTVNS